MEVPECDVVASRNGRPATAVNVGRVGFVFDTGRSGKSDHHLKCLNRVEAGPRRTGQWCSLGRSN